MKTITEILLECEKKDRITDGKGNFWTIKDKYDEEKRDSKELQTVVISIPDPDNSKDYELWSVGLESDVSMEGLHKL